MAWYDFKDAIADAIGISHDVLHVHLGIAIFIAAAASLQRFRHWPLLAVLVVLALEIANEILDGLAWIGWTGGVNWAETLRDIGNTVIWPSAFAMWIYARGECLSPGSSKSADGAEDP